MALTKTAETPQPHGERSVADAEAETPGLLHDADLPRASERTTPVARALVSALAVGLGFAAICWGVAGMFFTEAVDDNNDFWAAAMTLAGGVCFALAGLFIWRDRLIPTIIFTVLAVAAGVVSTTVM